MIGGLSAKSGETTQVRRSRKDMDIACRHPGQPDAAGRAVSRANRGIGAIIDHNKGTAFTYPTSTEQDGLPVLGAEPSVGK